MKRIIGVTKKIFVVFIISIILENSIVVFAQKDQTDYCSWEDVTSESVIGKNMKSGELTLFNYTKSKINYNSPSVSCKEYEIPACIPENIQLETSTRGIIGNDNRTLVTNTETYPNSAVVFVQTWWKNGDYTNGTGFMVNRTQIITAGHCVYSAERGGFADGILVSPGANGDKLPFEIKPVSYMYCGGFSGAIAADWAVMDIEKGFSRFPGSFGVRYTTSNLTGTKVTSKGYPGDYNGKMCTVKGDIMLDSNNCLYTKMDIVKGQSGSPIYINDPGYLAIGIASTEVYNSNGVYVHNIATKIREQLFLMIGGKINNPGEFSDGSPFIDITDGDPDFNDGTNPDFGDGN